MMVDDLLLVLLIIDMFSCFDFLGVQVLVLVVEWVVRQIWCLRDYFDDYGWLVIYVNDNFLDWKCDFC